MTNEGTDNKLQMRQVESDHSYMLSLEMQKRKFEITSYGG